MSEELFNRRVSRTMSERRLTALHVQLLDGAAGDA